MTKLQALAETLAKELKIINDATVKVHTAKELTKQTAVLQYKKIQLIKSGKSINETNEQLAKLKDGLVVKPPKINATLHQNLQKNHDGSPIRESHLANIAQFLNSQRVYSELIERYNPGLRQDQEDHVRKTANRVGLSIPEN